MPSAVVNTPRRHELRTDIADNDRFIDRSGLTVVSCRCCTRHLVATMFSLSKPSPCVRRRGQDVVVGQNKVNTIYNGNMLTFTFSVGCHFRA